jgi:hypothetical protein
LQENEKKPGMTLSKYQVKTRYITAFKIRLIKEVCGVGIKELSPPDPEKKFGVL